MSQNPVSHPIEHSTKDNVFYFQFILTKLDAVAPRPTQTQQFFFSISKGWQIIECTKSFIVKWKEGAKAEVGNERLNFVVLHYNPEKSQEFYLRISPVSSPDDQIGEYFIDCNKFIEHFKTQNNGAFIESLKLGSNFILQAQIYVERSRFNIEKLVREMRNTKKGQKSNSHIFQIIPEKPGEIKTRGSSPQKQNRFRRTPSPTRRLNTQKLRDQSPKRSSIGPRKTAINQISKEEKIEVVLKNEQIKNNQAKIQQISKQIDIKSPIQASQQQIQQISDSSKGDICDIKPQNKIPQTTEKGLNNQNQKQNDLRAQVELIDEKTVLIKIDGDNQQPLLKIQQFVPPLPKKEEQQPIQAGIGEDQTALSGKIEELQTAQVVQPKEEPLSVGAIQEQQTLIQNVKENQLSVAKIEQHPEIIGSKENQQVQIEKIQQLPVQKIKEEEKPAQIVKTEEKLVQAVQIQDQPFQIAKIEQTPVQIVKNQEQPVQVVKIEDNPAQIAKEQKPITIIQIQPLPIETENFQIKSPQILKVEDPVAQVVKVEPIQSIGVEQNIIEVPAEDKPLIPRLQEKTVENVEVQQKPVEVLKVENSPVETVKVNEQPVQNDKIQETPIQVVRADEIPILVEKVQQRPEQVIKVEETPVQNQNVQKIVSNELEPSPALIQVKNGDIQIKQQQCNIVDRASENWNKLVEKQRQSKEPKEVVFQNVQQIEKNQNAQLNQNTKNQEQKTLPPNNQTIGYQKLKIIVPILIILIISLLAVFSLRSTQTKTLKSSPKTKGASQKVKNHKKATKPKKT